MLLGTQLGRTWSLEQEAERLDRDRLRPLIYEGDILAATGAQIL